MKKSYILLILSTLIVLLFVSCKQKTIKTIEKKATNRYFLAADTTKGVLNVDISIEIPVCFDNETILDSVRSEIIRNLFGNSYVELDNKLIVEKFSLDLSKEYRQSNSSILDQMDSTTLYSFNNEHILEGFSLLNDKNIYSYGISRYVFMGGAHGLSTLTYLNFDLKTGKRITEEDLFTTGFVPKLTEILKSRIIEQSIEDKDIEPISILEDTDYWVDAIKPNGNFYITDESINYVFNPYEIAPYYMGQTEVVIPFIRLSGMFKPTSVISQIINNDAIL